MVPKRGRIQWRGVSRLCKSSDTADSQVTKVPVDTGTLGMPITRMSNIRERLEAGCRKSKALSRLGCMLTFWNFRVLHPELCRAVRLTTTVTIPTKHHEHINEVYQIYVSSQQPYTGPLVLNWNHLGTKSTYGGQ